MQELMETVGFVKQCYGIVGTEVPQRCGSNFRFHLLFSHHVKRRRAKRPRSCRPKGPSSPVRMHAQARAQEIYPG